MRVAQAHPPHTAAGAATGTDFGKPAVLLYDEGEQGAAAKLTEATTTGTKHEAATASSSAAVNTSEGHQTTAIDAASLEQSEESVAGESQWERSGEVSIKIAEVSSRDS